MMDDFNEAMGNIEKGLTGNRDAAAEAKSVADSAFKPGQMPYVTGTYTGNGDVRVVELGFRPSFVIISGMGAATSIGTDRLIEYIGFTAGNALKSLIAFTDTGFTVTHISDRYPQLCYSGASFDYIAFR